MNLMKQICEQIASDREAYTLIILHDSSHLQDWIGLLWTDSHVCTRPFSHTGRGGLGFSTECINTPTKTF
jgi:hypothetical protein